MEKTFAIVKPDAIAAGHLGGILDRIRADAKHPFHDRLGEARAWLEEIESENRQFLELSLR